jgi:glucosylglycerate synthase
VVIHGASAAKPSSPPSGTDDSLRVLSFPKVAKDSAADPVESLSEGFRTAFNISENLGGRACGIIASDAGSVTPQWIYRLVRPVLELDFDLATPCYVHHKFEGLINSSIISPMTRALYGRQIQHPMGPDFGISGRSISRYLGNSNGNRPPRTNPPAGLASSAICAGLEICEVYVGERRYGSTDWANLSSLLAQLLGPVFLEVEQSASYWQKIRGSQSVPIFGEQTKVNEEAGAVDVRHMIESFQLGFTNLREIWGMLLPPASMLELGKLARQNADRFNVPDELWVRIVYDFALGHRLRTINRDHLLRAITPIYLAWVASYALEMGKSTPSAVDQRLERLSVAYETAKPYFLSRWRWPDRFNP